MKTWQKPQLIVLVRSRPEETLLNACKFIGQVPYAGPIMSVVFCFSVNESGVCVATAFCSAPVQT